MIRASLAGRRHRHLPAAVALTSVLAVVLCGGALMAADTLATVSQAGRAFTAATITLPVGGVLRVKNDDEFVHQLYVNSPAMTFESDEQVPGQTVDLPFTKTGVFEVRCHIHPRMLLQVTVR